MPAYRPPASSTAAPDTAPGQASVKPPTPRARTRAGATAALTRPHPASRRRASFSARASALRASCWCSVKFSVCSASICAVYRAPTNRPIEAAVPGTTAASHGPASKTAANTNGRSHHRRRLRERERSSCTNITPKQNMPCGRGLDFGIIENNDKRMWERFHETK